MFKMASVTEYLEKLQELTKTNLDILKALNDSFFTKQNHLSVNIGDNSYAIPSFISLENKVNYLISNFENLVHAPETGEAFFNFDGNSRSISVRPYTTTPNSITLSPIEEFGVENNDIFKDFVTPKPYIHLNIQSIPNDITEVIVKKVIPINQEIINIYQENLQQTVDNKTIDIPSKQYNYKDLYKILSIYQQDKDYIEYDTKMSLPIRKNIGHGVYVIEKIIEDIIDENLDNYITIKLRNDLQDSTYMNSLKYRLFDETIEKQLKVGDQLVTYEGNAKMEITNIQYNTNTITIKVLHGEFLNLVESNANDQTIHSLSKIKFYSPVNFADDKYIDVPLEEDKYVFIAIAPLNSRMNVQSSWGGGLMVNTYELTNINTDESFSRYYQDNVKNIGDTLFEIISTMSSNTIMKYSKDEFDGFSKLVPIIDPNNILVTQINKHLDDSETVKTIRNLYAQKNNYKTQLNEIQTSINDINELLSQVSFDDVNGIRAAYTSQLTDLSARKNDISSSITKILDEISLAANNSEIPIENAKYRIRGFFNYETFLREIDRVDLINHVKGIRVQYRYKNVNRLQGNAMTINDSFIFSDWNNLNGFDRNIIPSHNGDTYKFNIQPNNDKINEPSFNQIDIPISQGETVDIRLKIIYDFGYPFIESSSDWSEIINIKFPEEYLKDVQLLDIISENNNDIETNRFKTIIKEDGISEHIIDRVTDQDITYFHKPENIASGFYTNERRIIPLRDKLTTMDAEIMRLKDEIFGSSNQNLTISIKNGDTINDLLPYQINNISVAAYDEILKNNDTSLDGLYEVNENKLVATVLNISIYNDSDHTAKLFSMFPGSRDAILNDTNVFKYSKDDYIVDGDKEGVYIEFINDENSDTSSLQKCNQFLYFRTKDAYTGQSFYESGAQSNKPGVLSSSKDEYKYTSKHTLDNSQMWMYPKLNNEYGLHINTDNDHSYLIIAPHEEIIIPIIVEYYFSQDGQIYKTMSFDIRPSLYSDPITYTFKVIASNTSSIQEKVIRSNRKKMGILVSEKVKNPKYNITIK